MLTTVHAKANRVPPLRAVRQSRGLSLRETARRAELDISHLSRIERGQARVTVETLARLAKVLGLTELERHLELYTMTPEMRVPGLAGQQCTREDTNDAKPSAA
jgi:transcriptional regulator with XRE-family HTH domain